MFNVFHADHGISKEQMAFIQSQLMEEKGFFIKQVNIPVEMGSVPCGLYGPEMGDGPVPDKDVVMVSRGNDRPWDDRILKNFPTRPVNYVQAIGMVTDEAKTLFTVYGGPLAPQNPADPDCQNVEESTKYWEEHALIG